MRRMGIREFFQIRAQITRTSLSIAMWKQSHAGRDQFRKGYYRGYSAGHNDGATGRINYLKMRQGLAGHRQVEIYGVEVDEGIAPLLEVLWRLGLETQFSCQGDPDYFVPNHPHAWGSAAQIIFETVPEAEKFVRKSIEILDSDGYHEGGWIIKIMSGIWGSEELRAEVIFSPTLLPELVRAWSRFESELAAKGAADEDTESIIE